MQHEIDRVLVHMVSAPIMRWFRDATRKVVEDHSSWQGAGIGRYVARGTAGSVIHLGNSYRSLSAALVHIGHLDGDVSVQRAMRFEVDGL